MSGVEGSEDMEEFHYPAEAQGAPARFMQFALKYIFLDEPDGAARHPYAEPERHRHHARHLGEPR